MPTTERFWSGGRRRFVAKTLATIGVLLVGGLVTSEVLERLSGLFKSLIGTGAVAAVVGAIIVWSDEGRSSEEE